MLQPQLESKARLMIMQINKTDGQIQRELKEFEKPAVITLHDAFVYFFQYYGIEFVGSVLPAGGKDPSPRQLKELADVIKAKHIKAILIEPRMNPKPAQTLASELNLKMLSYDDLGTATQAQDIAGYLWLNWLSIKAGL